MTTIQIFLASSINEFHIERLEIGNFIRIVNDRIESINMNIQLHVCEDVTEAISSQRKQDDYNDLIVQSDLFILLSGKTIGQYTLEEYEIAKQHHICILAFEKEKNFHHIDQVKWMLLQELNSKYFHLPLEIKDEKVYWNDKKFNNIHINKVKSR